MTTFVMAQSWGQRLLPPRCSGLEKNRRRAHQKASTGLVAYLSSSRLELEVDGQVQVGGERTRFAQHDVRVVGDLGNEPLILRHHVDRRASPRHQRVWGYTNERSGLLQDVAARRADLLERLGAARKFTGSCAGFGTT